MIESLLRNTMSSSNYGITIKSTTFLPTCVNNLRKPKMVWLGSDRSGRKNTNWCKNWYSRSRLTFGKASLLIMNRNLISKTVKMDCSSPLGVLCIEVSSVLALRFIYFFWWTVFLKDWSTGAMSYSNQCTSNRTNLKADFSDFS